MSVSERERGRESERERVREIDIIEERMNDSDSQMDGKKTAKRERVRENLCVSVCV